MRRTLLVAMLMTVATLVASEEAVKDETEHKPAKWELTEETLDGTWFGTWSGRFPVYFRISMQKNAETGETRLMAEYNWVERPPHFSKSDPMPMRMAGGAACFGSSLFFEPVPDQPGVIFLTGLFSRTRTTALYKGTEADTKTGYGKPWRDLINRLQNGRRDVIKSDSAVGRVIVGYAGRRQTAEERKKSGVDGRLVEGVPEGYGAKEAGMRVGDILTEVNGRPVATPAQQALALYGATADVPVSVTVRRDGKDIRLSVKLTKRDR